MHNTVPDNYAISKVAFLHPPIFFYFHSRWICTECNGIKSIIFCSLVVKFNTNGAWGKEYFFIQGMGVA